MIPFLFLGMFGKVAREQVFLLVFILRFCFEQAWALYIKLAPTLQLLLFKMGFFASCRY
jgi:hypothetical protein